MKLNKHLLLTYVVVIIGFLMDRISKIVAEEILINQFVDFGLLRFDLVYNTGAAYGIFQNSTHILLGVGIVVILYLIVMLPKFVCSKIDIVSYGVILAGAIGNTWDRLFYGKVIDFINIQIIPVFNIADMLLNII